MDNPQQREEELFALALAKPTGERAAFLDGACHGDPALRARLEALLASHEQQTGLNAPAPDLQEPTVKIDFVDERPDETIGSTIGHYKVLQNIGEGGCGAVYMAEQKKPVRRRVALKVIKLGMDTKAVMARFEAERQALALMDHPNIAKVLDAGSTDTGRPYFVMELVRGIKITDYCDQNKLNTHQRLDLFIQICHAIQHAHQKGIIHRDIKPSNILVTLHDGVPVPKVIDFGIAKATTDQQLTDKTLFTAYEQFIGTPAYMSPEQAEMSGLDIDTRSDIYSLGVLLYELLTGRTPFDGKELMSLGIDAMRKTIREKEPSRPSAKLHTLQAEELTTTALCHGAEMPKLVHLIRGDLDWIVMKCLEKDRARRYDTANGLAMDIRRHLNHEPVLARPPSKLYEFGKSVRRHKLGFAAAGAVGVALVAGLVIGILVAREQRLVNWELQAKLNVYEAQVALSEGDFDKVANLLTEVPKEFYEPNNAYALLRRLLGIHYAVNSQWTNAAPQFIALLEANQHETQVADVIAMDYLRSLPVLVRINDLATYESLRRTALARYGNTQDPLVAERLVRVCLLTRPSEDLLGEMTHLGDVLRRAQRNPALVREFYPNYTDYALAYFTTWRCLALAQLEYYRKAYTNSIALCQRQLELSDVIQGDREMRNAATHTLLAMNYQACDDPEAARNELHLAKALIDEAESHPMAPNELVRGYFSLPPGPCWFDWNINHVLYREAKALIGVGT